LQHSCLQVSLSLVITDSSRLECRTEGGTAVSIRLVVHLFAVSCLQKVISPK
jgi:hypothetical protein